VTKYFETRSKKGRGMARESLALIGAMHDAARASQPITGRGVGYKLFTAGLIPSMARAEMQRVFDVQTAFANGADRARREEPARGGTPSTTVEALMYALRSGLQCLAIPANRDRLRGCDAAAIKAISARLLNLSTGSKGQHPDWSAESVAKLIAVWRVGRQV
jgi:hypothetical protein